MLGLKCYRPWATQQRRSCFHCSLICTLCTCQLPGPGKLCTYRVSQKKWPFSFLAIKWVFINVKLKVWYVLEWEDQVLTVYEINWTSIFANICQYLPTFANICKYFHISANLGLFLIVKSKVWHALESAHTMQQLYDTIGQ